MILPADLLKAASQRNLIFVIGAGFSMNISDKFPSWGQVASMMSDYVDFDPGVLQLHGDYLQIAEYLRLKNRLSPFLTDLSRTIDNPATADVRNSLCHLLLPHLESTAIYTTNWDSWIERGFEKESIPYEKIAIPTHFTAPITPRVQPPGIPTPIVKFHGDFGYPDSIVVTESQYQDRLEFGHPIDIRFRSDIMGKAVIFIGYSFSDPNIRLIWHKLSKIREATGLSMPSFYVSSRDNPVQAELLRAHEIRTVLLDPVDVSISLLQFLRALRAVL